MGIIVIGDNDEMKIVNHISSSIGTTFTGKIGKKQRCIQVRQGMLFDLISLFRRSFFQLNLSGLSDQVLGLLSELLVLFGVYLLKERERKGDRLDLLIHDWCNK